MAKPYLEKLSAMLILTIGDHFENIDLQCKHFFSGAAVYVNGKICISFTPVGLALKLPQKLRAVLLKEKGASLLRYFPKAPIKKEYVVLPNEILNDLDVLTYWVKKTIEYALIKPLT